MIQEMTKKIPFNCLRSGYLKMPEWLFYFMKPSSIALYVAIKKTIRSHTAGKYSNATNIQLAQYSGLAESTVSTGIQRLCDRGYVRKWTYYDTKIKKRRHIYLQNTKRQQNKKIKGRDFHDFIISILKIRGRRIEVSRVYLDDWLSWIPIPNGISDGFVLKVYALLVGQYLRDRRNCGIRISDRQMAGILNVDRDKIADVLTWLEVNSFISIKTINKRSRIIEIM